MILVHVQKKRYRIQCLENMGLVSTCLWAITVACSYNNRNPVLGVLWANNMPGHTFTSLRSRKSQEWPKQIIASGPMPGCYDIHTRLISQEKFQLTVTCQQFLAQGLETKKMTWLYVTPGTPLPAVGSGAPVRSIEKTTGSLHLPY